MGTSIEQLQWNADGELAAQRLRHRGVYKFTSDQYMREFQAVQRERLELEAQRRDIVRGYIRETQTAGVRSYEKAEAAVISSLKLFAESGTTAKHRLANVLSAARSPHAGKVDTETAVTLMRMMPDDVKSAANVRFNELTQDRLKNIRSSGTISSAVLQGAMNAVLKENPALAAAVSYGSGSRELLDILFWPVSDAFE